MLKGRCGRHHTHYVYMTLVGGPLFDYNWTSEVPPSVEEDQLFSQARKRDKGEIPMRRQRQTCSIAWLINGFQWLMYQLCQISDPDQERYSVGQITQIV